MEDMRIWRCVDFYRNAGGADEAGKASVRLQAKHTTMAEKGRKSIMSCMPKSMKEYNNWSEN